MTAITYYTSSGTEGRCDAKCHDAQEPECHCICGGALHGAKSGTVALGHRLSVLIDEIFGVQGKLEQPGLFREVKQ